MDKAIFREKIDSMIPDLIEGIRKDCDRLFDCGGVDTSSFENDYRLARIILTVAIENQIRRYKPLGKNDFKEVSNLRHF